MTAGLLRCWIDEGRLELALPGSGRTGERFRQLATLAGENLTAARIAEGHSDAVAILHELGGKPPEPGQLWGVWAAESAEHSLTAGLSPNGDYSLDGTKPWCSGADICTHALVTAQLVDGQRGLFAVELTDWGVRARPSSWWNAGMAGSDTRSVQFTGTRATLIGEPGQYLQRPGFWHGAIGVAACWFGGARAVAGPLYERVANGSDEPHLLAHLGAVDAALLLHGSAPLDADGWRQRAAAHEDRPGGTVWRVRRLMLKRQQQQLVAHAGVFQTDAARKTEVRGRDAALGANRGELRVGAIEKSCERLVVESNQSEGGHGNGRSVWSGASMLAPATIYCSPFSAVEFAYVPKSGNWIKTLW